MELAFEHSRFERHFTLYCTLPTPEVSTVGTSMINLPRTPERRNDSASSKSRSTVSFDSNVVFHELPPLSPLARRALFYDQIDIRRFQVQEKNRLDQEASDMLIRMMAINSKRPVV